MSCANCSKAKEVTFSSEVSVHAIPGSDYEASEGELAEIEDRGG